MRLMTSSVSESLKFPIMLSFFRKKLAMGGGGWVVLGVKSKGLYIRRVIDRINVENELLKFFHAVMKRPPDE